MKYNNLGGLHLFSGKVKYNDSGGLHILLDRTEYNDSGGLHFLSGKTKILKVSNRENSFKVWKTIKLGTFKNADEFCEAFKKNGFKIGDWGYEILGNPEFTVFSAEEEIQLVNVSVASLGFKNGANYEDICAKAKEFGLELCPSEVGPQLRLQYKDQPKGEYLNITMEPITNSDGDLSLFYVEHDDDGLWLDGNYGFSGYFWDAYDRFVFRLCK